VWEAVSTASGQRVWETRKGTQEGPFVRSPNGARLLPTKRSIRALGRMPESRYPRVILSVRMCVCGCRPASRRLSPLHLTGLLIWTVGQFGWSGLSERLVSRGRGEDDPHPIPLARRYDLPVSMVVTRTDERALNA
ncbi:unnamed protein product, partial [Protopolystoma xenopodis]